MALIYVVCFTRKDELKTLLAETDGLSIESEADLEGLFKICNNAYESALAKNGLPPELAAMYSEANAQEGGQSEHLQAAEGKGFTVNGAVWNQWTRRLKNKEDGTMTKLGQDYANLSSRIEKRSFRDQWAVEEFKDLLVEKTHQQHLRQKVEVEQEWYTFGGLVKEFGGWKWKPAIIGAKLHSTKAARLGPQWCQRESMNSLLWFRRDKTRSVETFDQAWSLLTVWNQRAKVATSTSRVTCPEILEANALAAKSLEQPESSAPAATAAKGKTKVAPKPKGKPTPKTDAKKGKAVKRGRQSKAASSAGGGDENLEGR